MTWLSFLELSRWLAPTYLQAHGPVALNEAPATDQASRGVTAKETRDDPNDD